MSPKLNGCVKRVHRARTEKSCEIVESSFNIAELG